VGATRPGEVSMRVALAVPLMDVWVMVAWANSPAGKPGSGSSPVQDIRVRIIINVAIHLIAPGFSQGMLFMLFMLLIMLFIVFISIVYLFFILPLAEARGN